MNNKLITFEGIDGCGKTTQINLLSNLLDDSGIGNIIVREPGNTLVSEKIRDILLDNNNKINEISETLLFLSSRSQLVSEVIEKAIRKNKVILCDRYIDSTIAYQGYGRGLDINKLYNLNAFATKDTYPDITFIFDIDLNTAIQRLSRKNNDRMENLGKSFFENVKNGYIDISKSDNRYRFIDCKEKSPEQINNEVIQYIRKFYKGEINI